MDFPPARGSALRALLELRVDVRSPTMLMRRSALESIGRYDESLPVEDCQSILGLAHIGEIAHVPEILVYRRVHGMNISFNSHQGRKFSFDDFAYSVLQRVVPPDMPFDRICAMHAGIALHNALGQGGFDKVKDGYAACWREFPGGRQELLKSALGGLRTYVWLRYVMPRLPKRAVTTLRRARYRARSA